ncbi:MAG TPA: putative quinol monooxygenase [Deltaproteobacteria bacterium]|nr:putative quinol monooxygenase [Deltaproteobacteria bacterium]
MLVVHVFVHVKPEYINAFIKASKDNAQNSIQEPGIVRFDLIRQADDPARFVLVEIYRTKDDPAKHKETDHYKKWRDTVEDMMAEPRYSIKYENIYPEDENWQ